MAYSVGEKISADHYNAFEANVNMLWGVGSGINGWGQDGTIDAVGKESITAAQWSTLVSRLNTIRHHQSGLDISLTNTTGSEAVTITSGSKIYRIENIADEIAAAFTNQRYNNPGQIANGRTNPNVYETSILDTYTLSYDMGSQARGNTGGSVLMRITWESVDKMRYFFNTGGSLELHWSMTNSGTAKTQSWSNLFSDIGYLFLGSMGAGYTQSSGTWDTEPRAGYPPEIASEFYTIFKKFNDTGVADYDTNYVRLDIRRIGASLDLSVAYVDAASDDGFTTWPNPPWRLEDYIDFNAVFAVRVHQAKTGYITNTWAPVTRTI